MSRISVSGHKVYLDRKLDPARGETEDHGFVHAAPPPMLKDEEREAESYRRDLRTGEGDISILLEAGDELGQIQIGLQFEGPVGAHQECLREQGQLLQNGSLWLKQILEQFETDWNLSIVSAPCPKGDTRVLKLNELMPRLESRSQLQQQNIVKSEVEH
jgi:hypothetical protein